MPSEVNFAAFRAMLKAIGDHLGEGFLVSCSWDGQLLRVAVGRRSDSPDAWRKPWVMTFDEETDYAADPAKLVSELTSGARAWFGASKAEADEIERLLVLARSK